MNTVTAVCSHSDTLQIREPAPPGFIMGMADIIACCRTFAADFTFFCHDKTPYMCKAFLFGLYENGLYTFSCCIRQAFSKVYLSGCVDTSG
jgi:hypothetical protein